MVEAGTAAFHAHESSCMLMAPTGTAGADGCPEQNAPEQRRGDAGAGSSCNCPATSPIDESSTESNLEVTRCEQPASAAQGAINAIARSDSTTPARRETSCLKEKDLNIRSVKL